jgi:hypothetical protein
MGGSEIQGVGNASARVGHFEFRRIRRAGCQCASVGAPTALRHHLEFLHHLAAGQHGATPKHLPLHLYFQVAVAVVSISESEGFLYFFHQSGSRKRNLQILNKNGFFVF